MQVEEQIITLCFPTPICCFDLSDYELINDAIRVDISQFHDCEPKSLPREVDPISTPQVAIEAEQGTTIVFPSWFPHKVPKSNSNANRASIRFNAVLTAR